MGTVGRNTDKATVAYWVGNLTETLAGGGKVRLRGTFVFERRNGAWLVVQGHLSAPITDQDLAMAIFGTALVSLDPLRVTCDDGSPVTAPGAVPLDPTLAPAAAARAP